MHEMGYGGYGTPEKPVYATVTCFTTIHACGYCGSTEYISCQRNYIRQSYCFKLGAISRVPDKFRLLIRFQFRWWSSLLMRLRHSWLSYSTVPCVLYTSRPHSKKPLSRRLLRSLSSMAQMLSRIVQFPISRWCQGYMSGLLHSNSTTIYNPLVFCRLFTSAYDRAARQKLLATLCLISSRQCRSDLF